MIWRDKKLGKIFEKVAADNDLDAAVVRELFEKYFEYTQKCIASNKLPEVNFCGFGTLIPTENKTTRYINNLEEAGYTEELPELNESLKRIITEKNKRKRNK